MAASKRRHQGSSMGSPLTGVQVAGYKSILTPTKIDIAPLTVLAGANSSGKSSFLQSMLLMKQTLETAYDPGPLLLSGPNVKLTSFSDMLSRGKGGAKAKNFQVAFDFESGDSVSVTFDQPARGGIRIARQDAVVGRGPDQEAREYAVWPTMSAEKLKAAIPEPTIEDLKGMWPERTDREWMVATSRCFLDVRLKLSDPEDGTSISFSTDMFRPSESARRVLTRLIHLPGLRGNPERAYPKTAVASSFPGQFQDYVASIIHDWQETKSSKLSSLASDLEDMGLTWKVQAKEIDDTRVELQVGRLPHAQQGGAWDLVNIADVGFGLSQSLPVLVALHVAERNQIVVLEQPEIHLHPRAQWRLAKILAKAASRGVILLVETHSSLLLQAIQTLVANQELDHESVRLHWFERDAELGATGVYSGTLDDVGAFGDWPEDFGQVQLKSEEAFLNAVQSRLEFRG